MKFRILLTLVVASFCALLPACGSPSDKTRVTVRLVHAVTNGGAVDIWIQGRDTKLYENVQFRTVTLALSLKPGTYVFEVYRAFDSRSEDPLFVTNPLTLEAGTPRATLVATGLAGVDPMDPNAPRIITVSDGFSNLAEVEPLVRFVHAATGAPNLDLTIDDDDPLGGGDDDQDGIVLDLPQYGTSAPEGLPVDAEDPEQLLVLDADTDALLTSFTVPALRESGRYLVIFLGSLAVSPRRTEGFDLMIVDEESNVVTVQQNPRVYIMNAVADAPLINGVYQRLDPQLEPISLPAVLDIDFAFGALGGVSGTSIMLAPGNYEFAFDVPVTNPFPTVQPLLGSGVTDLLVAGEQYLFCVNGRADQTFPFQLVRASDKFDLDDPLAADMSLWRFVHAAPDATAVVLGQIVQTVFSALAGFPTSIVVGGTPDPIGVDVGIDEFGLVIARETDLEQFGAWPVDPTDGGREFVVLLGSTFGTPLPDTIADIRLVFVDTNVQPWTTAELFPLAPAPDPE